MNKPKLLRLTNVINPYSIPTLNALGEYYDVTVAHFGKEISNALFKQIILTQRKIGPFILFRENIFSIAEKFDAVLALGDLHVLPYIRLGFKRNRNYALTFWGIGLSASYDKKFDEDKSLDWIRFRIMNRADSLVFYSDYPIERYCKNNIAREKLFVAHNTVYIKKPVKVPKIKEYFLFVGTLYKAKKIYDLLFAYLKSYHQNNQIAPLIIIGDGDEKSAIEKWVVDNQLNEKIILKGAIFDDSILCELHRHAIASISPGQAGLSVLTSMAYGVPFITSVDSITGGERLNIRDGYNGFLYNGKIESLSSILNELSKNMDLVYRLSMNAQEYFFKYRRHDQMIIELKNSIDYAIGTKHIYKT
jgi:hypothetical protein